MIEKNGITYTSDITVRCIQKVGGDHMVVAAARVSTSGEEALKYVSSSAEENSGLINYLIKHRHGTPFEHASLTFFVHAPIFVWREWHRHRVGFSYNEVSGRYSKLEPVFWIPRRTRDMVPIEGYKPARPQFQRATFEVYEKQVERMINSYENSYKSYLEALNEGIAKEVSRAILPVGIYSSCWVTTNPRGLMNFLSLRTHNKDAKFVSYPQAEIEEAARACEKIFEEGWPLTYKSWVNNGRVAP